MANRDASTAIWDRSAASTKAARQAARISRNRTHGIIQGMVGGLVGTGLLLFWHRIPAYVVLSIAGVIFLSALLSPGLVFEKIRVGVGRFASIVGTVVAWISLLPIFYLFFTPFHFLFRRGRKDAMTRHLDAGSDSYWHVRDGDPPDRESYERQF